jgi:3',5'-cyclic AMP phosphodiesterase CpdA
VISDLNGDYGSTAYDARVGRAVERIVALKPDLVLITGDMVAGQRRPHLTEAEIGAMWQALHRVVTRPLRAAGLTVAITPGNHDASGYEGFKAERRIYAGEWTPETIPLDMVDRGRFPFYYAFAVGGVLFVSLDATTTGPLDAAQMAWLTGLLEGAGARYAQRVVFSHLPVWPVAQGRETEVIGDPALEALLAAHGVGLYLSGHHHAYYPGMKAGIAYVAQACLGSGPRKLIGDSRRSAQSFTMVEIGEAGDFDVYALEAPDFTRRVDESRLPAAVVTPLATLQRLDLARRQAAAPGPALAALR